ncbi:MAG: N-acetylmuramic acid 6-phosphate etherase [Planctomycetes bacterium]|nr:N-acetylmuramic acid 6-phosphate etherase [Planctomycetota bacterium]
MTSAPRSPEVATSSTEALAHGSEGLHQLDAESLIARFDDEQASITRALSDARPRIAELARSMARALAGEGRVIYVGAGTSGRLGVLDAAEWSPTFAVDPTRVLGRIAGGPRALSAAVEGAEDDEASAEEDLEALSFAARDLLIGLSASGGAPYVRRALCVARERGAARALITAGEPPIADPELLVVRLSTGPEILAGSTRLKAATATHQVLQRASTACAVLSGWVYAGRMVEMRPTNRKLRDRAERIVAELGELPRAEAAALLRECGDDIKVALVARRLTIDPTRARAELANVGRRLTEIPGF